MVLANDNFLIYFLTKHLMTMSGGDQAALEAELQRLQEQLEKKRLEEEIRQLQAQLQSVEKPGQTSDAGEDGEELVIVVEEEVTEYEEEEVTEYEEVVEEEEIVEDVPAPAPAKPATRTGVRTSRTTPNRSKNAPPPVSTISVGDECNADAGVTEAEKKLSDSRMNPKFLGVSNPFTRNMEAKKVAAQNAEKEKAATAAAGHPGNRASTQQDGPLPDLPPFKARVIPKLPSSPAGQETPMEVLLGPKLYKQGKLVATTTVAGLADQDLVMLYVGREWGRECKPFIPLLSEFYQMTSAEHKIECVYISQDRTLLEFKTSFANLPSFLAMPPGTSALKNKLAQGLKLVDLPSLVVIDPKTGNVITNTGVDELQSCQRRSMQHYNALIKRWKSTTPIPMSQVEMDSRLVNGNMQRGTLYWQE